MLRTIYAYPFFPTSSADNGVVQAGHVEKFRSWVRVNSGGHNTWLSPATFKSKCGLSFKNFPFDTQKCSLVFRSVTSDRTFLNIDTTHIKNDNPEEGKVTWQYLCENLKK